MMNVDARGLSCPIPVLRTKEAIDTGAAEIDVLVDNTTAKNNVTRFAKNAGYTVTDSKDGEDFRLALRK